MKAPGPVSVHPAQHPRLIETPALGSLCSAHLCLLGVFPVGADEDVESPELTTSRPLPKIGFTSAVPRVETTTLKTQNKIPAQTKVCVFCIVLAGSCKGFSELQRMFLLRSPIENDVRTHGLLIMLL